jgi:hypothetical protein
MFRFRHTLRFAALALVVTASTAHAGPPLLCHPFDIGGARSLPWEGQSWSEGKSDYNVANLVADTEAILTPDAPVIVRMETLRRAALYASRDTAVATRLLAMVNERARAAERASASSPQTAIALFDAGYLAATYQQISVLHGDGGLGNRSQTIARVIGNADGKALLDRTVTMRPDDAAIRFAAALVAASNDRSAYVRHAAKAREGAARDPLLARNIKQLS